MSNKEPLATVTEEFQVKSEYDNGQVVIEAYDNPAAKVDLTMDLNEYKTLKAKVEAEANESIDEEPAGPEETEEVQAAPTEPPVETAQESEEDKPKRKGGWQRKIDKLQAENEALLARLKESADKNLDLAGKDEFSSKLQEPQEESFDTYRDYLRALARHEIAVEKERDFYAQEVKAKEQRIVKAQETFRARADELGIDLNEVVEVTKRTGDVQISDALYNRTVTSDVGPALVYYLAHRPELARQISALPSDQQAYEFGRLEQAISYGLQNEKPKSAEVKSAPKQVTQAPPPPRSVAARAVPTKMSHDLDFDKMDFKTYRKLRDKWE